MHRNPSSKLPSHAAVTPLQQVLWANGSIYATTTRHVDNNVMKGHNLVALSTWLFMGDVGSTVGSNLLIYVKAAIGATHCHHCAHPY